jgi:hypothetical protein
VLRYRLDDLGWHHFEHLVQSLLKAELGLGVESWGGHGDNGRDAYAAGPICFPQRGTLTEGPFVFQVKFVEAANAAGADPGKALIRAVQAESSRIEQRIATGSWGDPRHYVLGTNVVLRGKLRKEISGRISQVLPEATVYLRGGNDICDLLDSHKSIARSFPELLSLRDLDQLLSEVVNREVLERSRAAVGMAGEVATVFVATNAYHRTLQILETHRFAVLDGPPEMGKTTIAWMISLAQILLGWQAIDCHSPSDFFDAFDQNRPQIFIVDDAFGRTEYDVTMGRKWERDLGKILFKIDENHWILLTTRKHILVRALKELDLSGRARSFPQPAEVVVTADDLSLEEKACILYRHARAAGLPESLRKMIRAHARAVVDNKHFTPERIRRLIQETLPKLAAQSIASLTFQDISEEIAEGIRNPTLSMQRSFRALPERHRQMLIALLDCNRYSSIQSLNASLRRFHEPLGSSELFETVEELLSAFLKVSHGRRFPELQWDDSVDWIHPSYRDLVIDELSRDLHLLRRFLRNASVDGLALAISAAGGPTGTRRFPLLNAPECWADLRENALGIAWRPENSERLLSSLISTREQEKLTGELRRNVDGLMAGICAAAEEGWPEARSAQTTIEALTVYRKACEILGRQPKFPTIEKAWEMYSHDLEITLDLWVGDLQILESWFKIVKLIETDVPEFFSSRKWRSMYGDDLEYVVKAVKSLLAPEEPDSRALSTYDAETLATLLREVPETSTVLSRELFELAEQCEAYTATSDDLLVRGQTATPAPIRPNEESFNIETLFSDL